MILIPELETVVILVPRTGSSSLRRALLAAYPKAMQIYRHMEADGVPAGYDRWPKVGVVRDPVERLWSLYKFLRTYANERAVQGDAYALAMRRSAQRPFGDWIIHNETVFTNPYDTAGSLRFFPAFAVRHSIPETRKSQYIYLRPDLGTEIYYYGHLSCIERRLAVKLDWHNQTSHEGPPQLSSEVEEHVRRFFEWDLQVSAMERAA
jgi:hypothetical protein